MYFKSLVKNILEYIPDFADITPSECLVSNWILYLIRVGPLLGPLLWLINDQRPADRYRRENESGGGDQRFGSDNWSDPEVD